jgi:Recombinase zinc beta ribbon domain/Resolvase, N terminal domain/Recombinase
MLAEVALDHVGIILGVEMSRLARSNKDWHQLLELCARFGPLIADLDGVYDPSRYNDRLLLGLKGTMSEAELHILRQRLLQGKLQKARRRELSKPVPTGYLRSSSGEVLVDPDEEVQAVVRMIFDAFERAGSIHGVLRELVKREVQIGVRRRTGQNLGQLVWHRPHRGMIYNVLHNAIYAGAYEYGRRGTDPRRQQPGRRASGRTGLLPPEQWQVCLRDRLPAYIKWEQYERNLARLKANRQGATPRMNRNGSALLTGLVVCGRCGYRMTVQYSTTRGGRSYPRYLCNHAAAARGEPLCAAISGPRLDRAITELALAALAPAALEVSLKVSEEMERERAKGDALWQQRLQRAKYEAERAERQYHAVEPENRLVARTLERAWEEKLLAERTLREQYERRQPHERRCLTEQERETIRALASDLPTLWNAPTTTAVDRKAVLHILVERVLVTVQAGTEAVDLVVRWAGGHETSTRIRRPVGKLSQLANHGQLLEQIRSWRVAGHKAGEIAKMLNDTGWVTPTQRNVFTDRLVRARGDVPEAVELVK